MILPVTKARTHPTGLVAPRCFSANKAASRAIGGTMGYLNHPKMAAVSKGKPWKTTIRDTRGLLRGRSLGNAASFGRRPWDTLQHLRRLETLAKASACDPIEWEPAGRTTTNQSYSCRSLFPIVISNQPSFIISIHKRIIEHSSFTPTGRSLAATRSTGGPNGHDVVIRSPQHVFGPAKAIGRFSSFELGRVLGTLGQLQEWWSPTA